MKCSSKCSSIEFLRRKVLTAALGVLLGLMPAANAQTGRPESARPIDSRVDGQSDTTRTPFTIDRPAIHPEMADMGGCDCDFFALNCWFNCVFGGGTGTGTGGGGAGSSDPCVQCKRDADRAFNTCLNKAAILYPISTPAYHDAFLECQEDQQNAYVDCSGSGPCNDL